MESDLHENKSLKKYLEIVASQLTKKSIENPKQNSKQIKVINQ